MSKTALMKVLVSEDALMGLTDSSVTRKEMDTLIKEGIDRSAWIEETSAHQVSKPKN